MNLEWHEDAEVEFAEDAHYYESKAGGLGLRFIAEVDATATRILNSPLMPRCFSGEFRKVRVSKFPYNIIQSQRKSTSDPRRSTYETTPWVLEI